MDSGDRRASVAEGGEYTPPNADIPDELEEPENFDDGADETMVFPDESVSA